VRPYIRAVMGQANAASLRRAALPDSASVILPSRFVHPTGMSKRTCPPSKNFKLTVPTVEVAFARDAATTHGALGQRKVARCVVKLTYVMFWIHN
jgi:hypothetical protein